MHLMNIGIHQLPPRLLMLSTYQDSGISRQSLGVEQTFDAIELLQLKIYKMAKHWQSSLSTQTRYASTKTLS